jgi:hypothetical protein
MGVKSAGADKKLLIQKRQVVPQAMNWQGYFPTGVRSKVVIVMESAFSKWSCSALWCVSIPANF